MVAPAPVNPHIEQPADGSSAVLRVRAKTTASFLRTFGFQVLALLLGIALAFM
jgi:hypothetical protein